MRKKYIETHSDAESSSALEKFERALELSQIIGDKQGEVIALINIAELNLDMKHCAEAAKYLDKAEVENREPTYEYLTELIDSRKNRYKIECQD